MKQSASRAAALACLVMLTALGGLSPARAQQAGPVKVTGKVVDDMGKPVPEVTVASFWVRSHRGNAKGMLSPSDGVTTDREGTFTIQMQLYGRDSGLLAMDADRKRGGWVTVPAKSPSVPVTITLAALTRVHGSFSCNELGKPPVWTNVYLSAMPGQFRLVMNESEKAEFDVMLPPGTYQFWGYGSDVDNLRKEIEVKPGMAELDLKTLDLPATIIAKHKGKAPPAWHVTDARGVTKDVKLADFKGKWVLMEFWGFW
jgi:hypothetical protein